MAMSSRMRPSRIDLRTFGDSVLNASSPIVPRLHVVTDASILARTNFIPTATRLLHIGPAIAFHLRDRTAPASHLADAAARLAPVARATGALLLVNARPDIAAAVGAAGTQLGHGDLATSDARRLVGNRLVGRSIRAAAEAGVPDAIEADFVMLGAIFPTVSHPGREPVGLGELGRTQHARVIAIGGVDEAGARAARAAGAWGIAVIRAIWDAPSPDDAARQLLEAAGASAD